MSMSLLDLLKTLKGNSVLLNDCYVISMRANSKMLTPVKYDKNKKIGVEYKKKPVFKKFCCLVFAFVLLVQQI